MAKRGAAFCFSSAIWLLTAQAGCAQASSANAAGSERLQTPAALKPMAISQNGSTPQPPPSETAAQPAEISLKDGKLTVKASNSDLSQILKDVANISGMAIKGLGEGPRIFGDYGPGNSRDVLSELLVGSGYNFIMVGGAAGAPPRELVLTPMIDNGPEAGARPASASNEASQPQPDSSAEDELGPGAISHPPPPDTRDDSTRIQQNLDRLRHIRPQQQNPPQ